VCVCLCARAKEQELSHFCKGRCVLKNSRCVCRGTAMCVDTLCQQRALQGDPNVAILPSQQVGVWDCFCCHPAVLVSALWGAHGQLPMSAYESADKCTLAWGPAYLRQGALSLHNRGTGSPMGSSERHGKNCIVCPNVAGCRMACRGSLDSPITPELGQLLPPWEVTGPSCHRLL
jgi:hypothetical protein